MKNGEHVKLFTCDTSGFFSSLSLTMKASVISMTEISAIHTMKMTTGGRDTAKPLRFSYGDANRPPVFVIFLA